MSVLAGPWQNESVHRPITARPKELFFPFPFSISAQMSVNVAVKALERLGSAAVILGGAASLVQYSMYDGKCSYMACLSMVLLYYSVLYLLYVYYAYIMLILIHITCYFLLYSIILYLLYSIILYLLYVYYAYIMLILIYITCNFLLYSIILYLLYSIILYLLYVY